MNPPSCMSISCVGIPKERGTLCFICNAFHFLLMINYSIVSRFKHSFIFELYTIKFLVLGKN